MSVSNYNYDQKGRIISITGDPLGTSTFEYDDKGHKTLIVLAASESVIPEGTQYIFPMPEDEDSYLPIPTGGHAKVLFNENDQPVEWQVSDVNGNLVNRLIRTYDENGRLVELRYTIESLLFALPAEAQQQFIAEPGAADEMTAQLTKLLGEQRNFMKLTYAYDNDGRLIEEHLHTGHSMETITKIAYNDHSDKLEELEFTFGDPNPHENTQPGEPMSASSPPPQRSITHYSYKYDNFGNWTEQSTRSATGANDANVIRRTLIYYSLESLEAETALSSQRRPGARFLQRMGSFFGLR